MEDRTTARQVNAQLVMRFEVFGSNGIQCATGKSRNWSSSPGTFRQTALDPESQCTPGFWCPADAFQPVYCCEGFYCPSPEVILECPSGFYCPMGSTYPISCLGLDFGLCGPGTAAPNLLGIIILFPAALLVFYATKQLLLAYRSHRSFKNAQQIHHVKSRMTLFNDPDNAPNTDVQFSNLSFQKKGQQIVDHLNGTLYQGELTCIIGPSGSGKSTLLNLLNGKIQPTSGHVLINHQPVDWHRDRRMFGYVEQDNLFYHELTVEQALTHASSTRLSRHMREEEKRLKVLEVVKILGLEYDINKRIGDVEKRGLSGGQLKRLGIAMEMVANPSILLLDEPTTGLDSTTSTEVIECLSLLAKTHQITIAATIHKPSSQLFERFDKVIVMGLDGRIVFSGPVMDMVPYFTSLGYVQQQEPEEFVMSILTGHLASIIHPEYTPSSLGDLWSEAPPILPNEPVSYVQAIRLVIQDATDKLIHMVSFLKTDALLQPMNRISQFEFFRLLFMRDVYLLFSNFSVLFYDVLSSFLGGVVASVAVSQFVYVGKLPSDACRFTIDNTPVNDKCEKPIDFLNGSAMIIVFGALLLGQSGACSSMLPDLPLYYKERATGMPALPWFMSRILKDTIRCAYMACLYLMSTLMFFSFQGTISVLFVVGWLVMLGGFQMGYSMSFFIKKENALIAATASSLFWGFLFSGVYPDYASVSSLGYAFMWELSIPRFAIEAIYVNDLLPREWEEVRTEPLLHDYSPDTTSVYIYIILLSIGWSGVAFLLLKTKSFQ